VLRAAEARFVIVVGGGGVGKTTLAAASALHAASVGRNTLVMTFDPSHRLKDALGIGAEAVGAEVLVTTPTRGRLSASLLDAKATFDGLVERYAPDAPARRRILDNRFYGHLAGRLAGILEYMAVERLFEAAHAGRFEHIVLDTPPTREALDFLDAPRRIVAFLDSGALDLALRPWFDAHGHLRLASRLGPLGRGLESWLDRIVGLGLLEEMVEFFHAFGPLYAGFRERALEVQALLCAAQTSFILVAGPAEESVPDTMFFARRLRDAGHRLAAVVVNRVHPVEDDAGTEEMASPRTRGRDLLRWLGERDRRGVARFRSLLHGQPVIAIPLLPREPTDLDSLLALGATLDGAVNA